MQDEVAGMVLRHNYLQTLAVSLSLAQAKENILLYRRYIQLLERNGDINRELEALPSDEEIVQRQALKQSFTRPEISVLLSSSKIIIKREILASELPEDPYIATYVKYTLPSDLYKLYPAQVMNHSLRRELIATKLSNDIVNEMGAAFIQRLVDETGATVGMIARAYIIAKNIFDMPNFWKTIEGLDKKVEASVQLEMILRTTRLVRRSTRWLLRHPEYCETVENTIATFTPEVNTIYNALSTLLVGVEKDHYEEIKQHFISVGVPVDVAERAASTSAMYSCLDIIGAVRKNNMKILDVATAFYLVGQRLETDWLRHRIVNHPIENNWESLSRAILRDDLTWEQIELVVNVLKFGEANENIAEQIADWFEHNQPIVSRWQFMLADFRSNDNISFTKFYVAVRELLGVVQASRRVNYERLIQSRARVKNSKANSK